MLAIWEYIEADFRRDYGIILSRDLPHMSWREFLVLCHGLSPMGAVALHYKEARKEQQIEEERKTGKQSPEAAGFWNMVAVLQSAPKGKD